MTKENTMTPMKKYRFNIDRLREVIKPFSKEISLNKVDAKSTPWSWDRQSTTTKGVDSDFIMIFQEFGSEMSFAFTFTYINLESNKQTVAASIKMDGDITMGAELPLSDFAYKINELVIQLESLKNSPNFGFHTAIDEFSKLFLANKLTNQAIRFSQDSLQVEKFLETQLENLNIVSLEQDLKKKTKIRKQAENKIAELIEASPLQHQYLELLEKVKKVKAELEAEKKSFQETNSLKDKINDEKKAGKALESANNTLNKNLQKELLKYPRSINKKYAPK